MNEYVRYSTDASSRVMVIFIFCNISNAGSGC